MKMDLPIEKINEYIFKQQEIVKLSSLEIKYALNDEHRKVLKETYNANLKMLKLLENQRDNC